jgi:hypothetical protein
MRPSCARPTAGERRGQERLGDLESLRDVDVDGDEPAGRLAVEQPEVSSFSKDMRDFFEAQSPLLPLFMTGCLLSGLLATTLTPARISSAAASSTLFGFWPTSLLNGEVVPSPSAL